MDQMYGTPTDTQGVLAQLREQMMQNPRDRQAAIQRRDEALRGYTQQLSKQGPEVVGGLGHTVQGYLKRRADGARNPALAMMGAIADAPELERQAWDRDQVRPDRAATENMRAAEKGVNETNVYSKTLNPLLRGMESAGGHGKQPSPEQLRTVYNGARNEAAQISKGKQFKDTAEQADFIESYANRAVQNYISQFAIQPTGPRGRTDVATATQTEMPSASLPGTPDTSTASTVPSFSDLPKGADIVMQEWVMNKRVYDDSVAGNGEYSSEALRNMGLARKELLDHYKLDPLLVMSQQQAPQQQAPQPFRAPQIINVPNRNIPQEKLVEAEAQKVGGARGDEYKTVQQAAAAAENQLQAFNTLEKIKPNTNAAANAQEHLAALFGALGQDPNSPMIQNAIKNREANQILDQLRNASLKAENGVQTKSDEDRIGREFPKTTDFKQAWGFGLKLGKERALRLQDRLNYYDAAVDGRAGVGKARSSWNTEMTSDPLTQYLGGKLIFRNDFIQKYMQKYPDTGKEGAVAEWREMEKDYQARGGKK